MITRCRLCVIPDSRPDTHFIDGVCSACISYHARPAIDWNERRQELLRILSKHNGCCVVPSSGGKDSHYQVLTLLELGAKPLVVTASTCHLTPMGRANIDNLARYAPTIEFTQNRAVRAKLNRLGLEFVGDISWPEHASIFSVPFHVANAMGYNLVFYGENPQNQYGGPPGTDEERRMTRRWVTEFGGFLGLRPDDFIGKEGITAEDMRYYSPPDRIPETYFLGQFIEWDSERNADMAREHGMRQEVPSMANYWAYENLDNAQTGLHDYFMFRKYGYGRFAAQVSVEIRKGTMTRERAMNLVGRFDGAYPLVYAGVPIGDVLRPLGLSLRDIDAMAKRFEHNEFA